MLDIMLAKECVIVDTAVQEEVRVKRREDEKTERYGNLCKELGGL